MLRNSRTKNVGILQCFIIVKTCVHKKKNRICVGGWSSITCEGGPAILKKLRRFSNRPPTWKCPINFAYFESAPAPPASPSEYSSYKLCRSSPRTLLTEVLKISVYYFYGCYIQFTATKNVLFSTVGSDYWWLMDTLNLVLLCIYCYCNFTSSICFDLSRQLTVGSKMPNNYGPAWVFQFTLEVVCYSTTSMLFAKSKVSKVQIRLRKRQLLDCNWRHGGHVGGQGQ